MLKAIHEILQATDSDIDHTHDGVYNHDKKGYDIMPFPETPEPKEGQEV